MGYSRRSRFRLLLRPTSKIRSVEDLLSILPERRFRALQRLGRADPWTDEMWSKVPKKLKMKIGAPEGTTFIVRNSTQCSCQKKIPKRPPRQRLDIGDLMERMAAVPHPDVSFKFINNGQTNYTHQEMQKRPRYHIYGKRYYGRGSESEHETEGIASLVLLENLQRKP